MPTSSTNVGENASYPTPAALYALPRHRWYVAKEGFSPDVLDLATSSSTISKNALIVDPFCGSGTIPLASSVLGHRSVGIEVNPFLAFVARTKLLSCTASAFDKALMSVLSAVKKGAVSPLERVSTFCKKPKDTKWLFNRAVLRSYEGGWQASDALRSPARDIVRLMLVRAAMENCNAIADGKCLRYRKDWQSLRLGTREFVESFESWSIRAANDLRECPTVIGASIIRGDSRQVLTSQNWESINLCVTSPPYLNSFDYSDIYRPEAFLVRAVRSNDDLRRIRLTTIRSHVQAKWHKPVLKNFGSLYNQTSKRLLEMKGAFWDVRIPEMVQAYFEDMYRVLTALRSKASKGCAVWLVVSTSAYAGVEIPVDLILAQIGERTGWYLRDINVLRNMRASGQHAVRVPTEEVQLFHLRESIVILDTQPARS